MTTKSPQRRWWHRVAPDVDAVDYLQLFLVAAVSAILVIRGYLAATGYPQISGGGLHIAHMLWGGLLMLVAIFMSLAVLGSAWKRSIALIGGAGFGGFIDELGKFITEDNNYFFQPTIAIIYVIFILLYLAVKLASERITLSPGDHIVFALDSIQREVKGTLTEGRRSRALDHLNEVEDESPIVEHLREILESAEIVHGKPTPFQRAKKSLEQVYRWAVKHPSFGKAVTILVIVNASVLVLAAVLAVLFDDRRFAPTDLTVAETGQALSTALATFFAALGLFTLIVRRSLLGALVQFERSVLTSIFLVQVFAFSELQWGALVGLFVSLLELGLIQFGIRQERRNALRKGQPDPLPERGSKTSEMAVAEAP